MAAEVLDGTASPPRFASSSTASPRGPSALVVEGEPESIPGP